MDRVKFRGDAVDDPVCRQMEERIVGYCYYVDYDAVDDDPCRPEAQPRHQQRRPQLVAGKRRMGYRSGRKAALTRQHA